MTEQSKTTITTEELIAELNDLARLAHGGYTKSIFQDAADRLGQFEQLRGFANHVMKNWPEINDIDMGDLQDMAIEFGLLKLKEPPTEPCGYGCMCADFYTTDAFDDGLVECYQRSDLLAGG